MNEQQRALAHLRRATDLLGFGAKKRPWGGDGPSGDDHDQLQRRTSVEEANRNAFQSLKDLHKGWIEDNVLMTADKALVLRASEVSPAKAFGYATEELQRNKELAATMFKTDPDSINAYVTVLDELPEMFTKLLELNDLVSIREMLTKKLKVSHADEKLSKITRENAKGLFEEFLEIERKRRKSDCWYRFSELMFGTPPADPARRERWEVLTTQYQGYANKLKKGQPTGSRFMLGYPAQPWTQDKTAEMMMKKMDRLKLFRDDPKAPSVFTS